MPDTKHKNHGKPTYLNTLEHIDIEFNFDEISQNIKPVSLYSTINSQVDFKNDSDLLKKVS